MSQAPARVGRYEIRRELGRGMMGVVFEAHDPMLHRVVALKTIHLSFGVSEAERGNFEQRFLTEARSAARLSHPGIVVVHDVGEDAETGTFFMALEYLRGRPLSALYSEDAPMEWSAALRIVASVAEALHCAHAAGIVHRDVKPANIMVLESGEPKVMDFGLAKLQTSQVSLTSSGQFFGTPLYMSPEQALGEAVDGRSDLFSLGSVAYALLTGRPPFTGNNIPQIFLMVANDDPVPPSHVNPALPPGVDEIVRRAMAKNPVDRYQDGEAMAQDIRDALAGQVPRPGAVSQTAEEPPVPAPAGSLDRAPGSAFGTRAPSSPRTRATARPTATGPAARPTPARPSLGTGGRVAIGLGILMAGSVAGALLVPRSSEPGRDPEGPASAAQPAGAERALDATAGSPAPATLAAEDVQRFGEAVAARVAGDLERSQRILQDLVDHDPGHTAAAELLQQVEAQLWARDALPLEYRAKHNHRIGSCDGQLTIEADAIAYRSRDHGLWRWGFDELEEMRRKNRRELELVTRENDALRLGSGKHYDFELQGATLDADDWARLRILVRGG